MPEVRWSLLMPDGNIIEGSGQDAPAGMKLSNLAEDAMHSRFGIEFGRYATTTIYVAGPVDLHWTIQNVLSYGKEAMAAGLPQRSKALALRSLNPEARVFLMPDGSVGIGRTADEVGAAFEAFAVKR